MTYPLYRGLAPRRSTVPFFWGEVPFMHTPSSHLSETKVVKNSSMNQAGASFWEGVSDPTFPSWLMFVMTSSHFLETNLSHVSLTWPKMNPHKKTVKRKKTHHLFPKTRSKRLIFQVSQTQTSCWCLLWALPLYRILGKKTTLLLVHGFMVASFTQPLWEGIHGGIHLAIVVASLGS